ncbi:hypothetical protein MHB48_12540 [Psychrobacillus sp. FSL H8-0483]|uniref:YqgU-like beta propeller domain-containing protein n=1 Tax=Psychrobacillus sp. FSL H8-0483 TaxID=2921389 RepID=UPI00315B33B4
MKKIGMLLLCLFLLQACKESNPQLENNGPNAIEKVPQTVPGNQVATPTKKIPLLKLNRSTFHSVIGWMSNDEILFILTEDGDWTVQSYNLSTETWKTIYKTETPIIQGIIHPSKEMILLHTSSNSSSAEIQLIHKNGYVVQSLSFESAEIYMDWHPTNPDLIVFSTFYDDWSYSTFVYDGSTQQLKSIEVENPFVKWYDEHRLMVFKWGDSSLDGSDLLLYSTADGGTESTEFQHVLDVQNLGDTMVYVQINETQGKFEYHMEQPETGQYFDWNSPAVSNYSEWVVPTFSVVHPTQLIAIRSKAAGNVDEFDDKGVLSSYSLNGEKRLGEIVDQPIDCSPNGEVCLGGYEKENWIQLNPFNEQAWLQLIE